ncbi:hypothetical protein HNP52_001844 [Sphingomonas kyeonggiensis]|uniref:Uncharacterized protein n=1 Tax=Sphingomonas kyeonggiensis TaxID=1268553 RepID=A0A7W7NR11_9SPHN|nr:hypothetical protein [Sphingomonas kyeonggiensis]MBB4838775.1 hypothetical protein [Sphingomonas kyeonggiensis]
MTALLTVLLFAAAFAVAGWTIVSSIVAALPRMRELIGGNLVQPLPELVPSRVTVRYATPVRRSAAFPLREAA